MALFGGTSSSRHHPKNLVEFRAGKMALKGSTVTPDKRKGLVYVYQSDDGLTHFCWKDRKSGTVEDDLIVFPDDCEYKKVTQCKEGSRVYLLKFKTSARKLFFWMQEPKTEGDDDLVWKVNESLNNPGGASSNGRAGQSGSATPTPSESEMQALIQNMSQSQLMQLIGGMGMSDLGSQSGLLSHLTQHMSGLGGNSGSGGSTATAASAPAPPAQSVPKPEAQAKSAAAAKGSASVQLQDLQKILSNINPNADAASVDLSTSVNRDIIRRITSSPATVKKLAPLLPQFGGPECQEKPDESSKSEVEETLVSPQFQTALSAFCAAFPTGQLGPLIQQFGMGPDAVSAAQSGNLEAFLNAIQKEVETPGSSDVKTEQAEDMNVD